MSSRSASSALGTGLKRCSAHAAPAARNGHIQVACSFSTTAQCQKTTKLRSDMYRWLDMKGQNFEDSQHGFPRYLGHLPNQPFPLNPLFRSEPVLDESMREEIYRRVKEDKVSLKAVSADLSVDIRRVAAVVRMKALEKQWESEGKKLAKPYANAILCLLPKTSYTPGQQSIHEPVNEIHVHKLTTQQLFVPVSESRQFTREDAAKAFHRNLLSADARSPHPELIELQKRKLAGVPDEENQGKFQAETKAEEDALVEKLERRAAQEEERTTRVDTDRFEYRFKDINMEVVGKNGRGRKAVGWRYGVPFNDRRKGQIKIPTSVP
ncbi:hypothetical protein SODALDRAFT_334619 [Sodiomyces alkalinus F11]|uniref:Ribosomal protein S35, mitochondrial n=1 Tax=Sodiomyces alkalinus (strain CBS 110278 / VKM F-3762 / F11) TaxID=1314773 RepID=A0A3N2PSL1_SODAK|nr:hypothetical protein SODALDRAFT_334619 [Sodiomyces alkalinus F11]ROT37509.1 hypothetical protein SODALDRAFT_334619 [Sodiomyces alkalinus F11]